MHGTDERDLLQTLGSMARLSVDRCNANKVEAKAVMKRWLELDRRFDPFDKDALVERTMLSRSNGCVVELDDPSLRGQGRRPLDRAGW